MKHLLLALLFLSISMAHLDEENGVTILNEKDYDKFIKDNKYVLVYFYAPSK